jgi:hypothetical protein
VDTVQNTLGPNARSSLGRALRRLPVIGELFVRSLVMTLVTYHRPRRDQLIVMFLDLADSTQLAEAMGELKVHDLIVVTWPVDADGARNTRCLECRAAIDRTLGGLAAIYQRAFDVVPQFRAALHCAAGDRERVGQLEAPARIFRPRP